MKIWILALVLVIPAITLAETDDQGHEAHQGHEEHQGHEGHQGHQPLQGNGELQDHSHQGHEVHQSHEEHQGHEGHQDHQPLQGEEVHQGHEEHQGHGQPQRHEASHQGHEQHQGHEAHEDHQALQGDEVHQGHEEHQGHDQLQGHKAHQVNEQHRAQEESPGSHEHQGHQEQAASHDQPDHQNHPGHQEHQGHDGHEGHNMTVDATGAVMNENVDQLPRGCDEISRDHDFTIYAGQKYASEPGMIFGMSEHEVNVEPCSRVNVTFINDDEVRHQWMVHGLPKYLYPAGMFHIEASGGTSRRGTFIVPAEERNYLIHCDVAQHMEMGMRGQLVVGDGGGDLWGVAGVSDAFIRAPYWPRSWFLWGGVVVALCASIFVAWRFGAIRRSR